MADPGKGRMLQLFNWQEISFLIGNATQAFCVLKILHRGDNHFYQANPGSIVLLRVHCFKMSDWLVIDIMTEGV